MMPLIQARLFSRRFPPDAAAAYFLFEFLAASHYHAAAGAARLRWRRHG